MSLELSLEDGRNIATIIGVLTALVVYITNSIYQHRKRQIENVIRFIEAHRQLFQNSFIRKNWRAFETNSFLRDPEDEKMQKEFSTLLGDIEYYALLHQNNTISSTMNIYMFGWWAQRLQPLITAEERNNIYWEVAIHFLDEMKNAADDFFKKDKSQRDKYLNFRHFLN